MTIFCHRESSLPITASRVISMHYRKPSWLGVQAKALRRESLGKSEARLTSASTCAGSTQSRGLEFSLVTLLVSLGHSVLHKGVPQAAHVLLNGAQDCVHRWHRSTS